MAAAATKIVLKPRPGFEELLQRPNVEWGNIAAMNEAVYLKEGRYAAHRHAVKRSEHLPSSGMSNTMTRKARKEHYRRKAILEAQKAKERRADWEYYHPHAHESDWVRREAKRDERKALERLGRRVMKKTRRNSSNHSRRSSKP